MDSIWMLLGNFIKEDDGNMSTKFLRPSASRGKNFRPPLVRFYPYLVFALVGYFAADLVLLSVRDRMLPDQAPPARPPKARLEDFNPRMSYDPIIQRNLFSLDGKIPDPLFAKKESLDGKPKIEIPVPSNLPLTLIGTLVHSNVDKSIAAIEVKSKNAVIPFSVGKDIERLATITKIERRKVIFRNSMSGKLEYIEIKDANKLSLNVSKGEAPVENANPNIKQLAPDKFEVSRAEILKATQNMSSLLMQAASIPRKKANGEIDGFTILNIQPGSIFSQLGITNGDTIKKINGENIDSPAKALELWNALKNSPNVKLTYERDGRDQDKEYNIK
jgi:general secretion pathway protein C